MGWLNGSPIECADSLVWLMSARGNNRPSDPGWLHSHEHTERVAISCGMLFLIRASQPVVNKTRPFACQSQDNIL